MAAIRAIINRVRTLSITWQHRTDVVREMNAGLPSIIRSYI
ncbi:MAG: hypothetical protein ACKVS9_15095 [Phycisphaerae bacterium]